MKVVGLAIVRTAPDLNEPIPMSVANDLSSFGFFQRQVCVCVRSVSTGLFEEVFMARLRGLEGWWVHMDGSSAPEVLLCWVTMDVASAVCF